MQMVLLVVIVILLIAWQIANHLSIGIIVVEVEVAIIVGIVVKERALIHCAEIVEVLHGEIVRVHEQRWVHTIEGELREIIAKLLAHVARVLLAVVGIECSSEQILLIRVQIGHKLIVVRHVRWQPKSLIWCDDCVTADGWRKREAEESVSVHVGAPALLLARQMIVMER